MKNFFRLTMYSFFTTVLMGSGVGAQTIFPLYDKEIPNSRPTANVEQSTTDNNGILRISKVSVPTLIMYPAPKGKANGTAVIICPGGGYSILAASHEGSDVARKFNEMGVTAFVLKYRLPSDETMTDKSVGPLQDAQRAIQMVRQHAKDWRIDKNKIGIMGFSAGGHLASTAGTHFESAYIDNPKKTSIRPDFMILGYPVISFMDSLAHVGSRNNLIGKNATTEQVRLFSNELQVTDKTPPTFLVHAKDDGGVSVQNSLAFDAALRQHHVPSQVYLYEKGGHGFGMNNKTSEIKWMDNLEQWMKEMKLL